MMDIFGRFFSQLTRDKAEQIDLELASDNDTGGGGTMSTTLEVNVNGDAAWKDLGDRDVIKGELTHVAGLANGTDGGNPTVAFRVELPDGRVVFTETTLALFQSANAALKGRYGVM